MIRLLGSDLRVGDTIEVWWSRPGHTANQDIIMGLRPYKGRLAHIFPQGAQLADFLINRAGMTIENHQYFTVIARAAVS